MSLAGYKAHQIMKMGRWAPKSTAFMEYIQQQLSTFSVGMSTRMSKIGVFTNMEGAGNADDLRAATIYVPMPKEGPRRDAALHREVGPGTHVDIEGGPLTRSPHFSGEVRPW